ncbi:MAG TPA: helix-turn-helix domain-containing protein [Alphaproteobacteria bacterium]|nr:helix-turn-helix domain-containing protein [Alphaproteobacteria bacterium]
MDDAPTTPPEAECHRPGESCAAVRRRDRAATREALLCAGRGVFAERGYDAATTREVAARAGCNEQLIQRYFGGKSGLLLAILDGYDQPGEGAGCRLPPAAGDLAAEVAGILGFHLQHALERDEFLRVAIGRALVDPAVAERLRHSFNQQRIACIAHRLRDMKAAGRIDAAVDPDATAAALWTLGFGIGFFEQLVFAQDCGRIGAVLAEAARLFAAGLAPRAGAQSEGD